MTPGQTLSELAASHRFRVVVDTEGWPVIPGRYGRLEYHDRTGVAISSDHPRVFDRTWAIPDIRRWQVGDQEVRGLVRPTPFWRPRT